jgi:hypothetical protein
MELPITTILALATTTNQIRMELSTSYDNNKNSDFGASTGWTE